MFTIRESNKLGIFIYSYLFHSKPYPGLRIYTTLPKVCGHQLVEHLITQLWALIWSWSSVCCYNSLHSSAKAFH